MRFWLTGLFHQAIEQSGAATSYLYKTQESAFQTAHKLANELGFHSKNPNELLKFFLEADAKDLVATTKRVFPFGSDVRAPIILPNNHRMKFIRIFLPPVRGTVRADKGESWSRRWSKGHVPVRVSNNLGRVSKIQQDACDAGLHPRRTVRFLGRYERTLLFFFSKNIQSRFANYFLRFVDLFFSFFFLFTGLYRIINNTADALKEMFNLKLDLLGPYESVKELSVVMFLTLRLKISKQ